VRKSEIRDLERWMRYVVGYLKDAPQRPDEALKWAEQVRQALEREAWS